MQFRTQIPISKSHTPISYDSRVVSLGSCFAVNMAEKLSYFKFENSVNPFGILFHPRAIERLVDFAVHEKRFSEEDLFFQNERWHCFDAHSDLSDSNPQILLDRLNSAIENLHREIIQTTHLIITYGTAWVYREKLSGDLVANCHKLPQQRFEKEILSVQTVQKSVANTSAYIRTINPQAQIILTISPVRHIKDGFTENQWSKSNLISGVHTAIQASVIGPKPMYFPSYEIMMDELRDYRFYAEDMIHPNQTAVDYIWECFSKAMISDTAFRVMDNIANIQKGLAHRPFHEDSESHRQFVKKLQASIATLQQQFPHITF